MNLSIITINYNNSFDLEKTINTVINQTYRDFEYIIIDGGSTDGSLEVIKRYEDEINYWISEKDKGVFNAMNKGIKYANGTYLLMLNAGDLLGDNKVLERVFQAKGYQEDILFGDVYRSVNGKIFEKSFFPDILTFNFFRQGSLSHQGTFIKKRLHDTIGLYDENLKYSADWKFFILAICKYNATYIHLPFFVAICDCTGLTCNPANFPAMKQEFEMVYNKDFPAIIKDYRDYDYVKSKTIKNKTALILKELKKGIKTTLNKYFYHVKY
jgi:glycosyltransferase involved in cell wall biosynthesis